MPALLDRVHQTVKVGAERLQAGGIQEEAALAGSMGRGARGGAALLREGNLLVLAEELDFALREAQLVVGDGGGHHNRLAVCTMLVASQGKQQPCMARPMRAGRAACVRARRRDSTLGGGDWEETQVARREGKPPRASRWDGTWTWTWTLRLGSHGPAQACCSPACAPAAARRTPHAPGDWPRQSTALSSSSSRPSGSTHGGRFRAAAPPARARRREGGGGRGRAAAARYGPPMEQVGGASPASASSGSTSAWSLYT